jgi:uncharacterized protein YoxC
MKKQSLLFVVLIGVLFVFGGCTSDPVKDDLVKYSNDMTPVMKVADGIEKKSDEISKEQNTKALVAKLRNDLLPIVTDVRNKMDAIKPASKEVQDIHTAYLAGVKDCEEGIKGLADAIEKQDQKLAKASADKMSSVGTAEEKFKKDIEELAKKHNVKP